MATVLVVDDEPDIRMLIGMMLRLDGHDVIEATNGAEALTAVEAAAPDLVVLDVMMPEVSGWDALASIKGATEERIRNVPVIMLTALSGQLDRVKGGIEGAVRYLSKPINSDELRATVQSALSGESEPVQRRQAQTAALETLARIERSAAGSAPAAPAGPRPRLTSLENARPGPRVERPGPVRPDLAGAVAALTTKQRELLEVVRRAPTVIEAAELLEMSRSNVYASLRRITRRLDVRSVSELLELLRQDRVLPKE